MNIKKLYMFGLIAVLGLTFAACDKSTTIETTIATTYTSVNTEQTTALVTTTATQTTTIQTTTITTTLTGIEADLEAAAKRVILSNSDNVVSDFTVPAEIGTTAVTWSSNNETVVEVGEFAIDVDGALRYQITVNRPTEAEGDITVILTGVFSYGSDSYTKTFTLRVRALTDASGVATIAEGISYGTGQYVTYLGMTIFAIVPDYGFFFTDGTDIMFYFDKGYTGNTIMTEVSLGSVYDITGEFSYFYDAPQLSDNGDNLVSAVASSAAVSNYPTIEATVSDTLEGREIPSETAKMEYTLYRLTAKVYVDSGLGDYGVYLVPTDYDTTVPLDVSVTDALRVYYRGDMDVIAAFQNQVITIDFLLYSYHSEHSDWYGYFYGTTNDVDAALLSDAEQLALYVSQVQSTYTVVSEFALPAMSKGTYSNITISTELTDYLSNSGNEFTVVRPEGSDVTGTISFDITVGETTQNVTTSITIRAIGASIGSDLFISEYIEGSSYNKYLELYNPTTETVDLSEYVLVQYNNGSTTVTYTLPLSGTLAPGSTYVIANSQAVIFTGTIDLVTSNALMGFNGDDVLVLLHNDAVIDSIGFIGNPKDAKYAENVTLIRKSSISSGDTDPYDVYVIADQWDVNSQDDVSDLGTHTID